MPWKRILTQSPCLFFQGTADRAHLGEVRTSGSLSSEGAGCGGGLVPDSQMGRRALKDPKARLEGM